MKIGIPSEAEVRNRSALEQVAQASETEDTSAGGQNPFYPPVFEEVDETLSFEESELYSRWRSRVVRGNPNDFIIAITPSSRTGVSGTGKTTFATWLAKQFDDSPSGFDAEKKATVDAAELAYEILPEVEDGSAVVFDESQGTPGSSGVDSRRAMKQTVIDVINSILANRDKRPTVIIVGQQLGMLDSRLYPVIDAWLKIQQEPDEPAGPMAIHHKITVDDYDLRSPKLMTPGIEEMSWPKLPETDSDYLHMEVLKQKAKKRRSESQDDAESHDPKKERNNRIRNLYDKGVTQQKIAESFGLTQPTVSDIINE